MRSTSAATPALVGVKAIGLVELGVHRHTFEKKWIKRHPVSVCKLGVERIEIALIILAPIGRGAHADEQQFGAAGLDLADHRVEIGPHDLWVDAAQRIIGAQFEDHDIGLVRKRPVEPGKAAGGGVARDASIDHVRADALGLKPRFEARRKARRDRQPQPGGKAVAKGEDREHMSRGGRAAEEQQQ